MGVDESQEDKAGQQSNPGGVEEKAILRIYISQGRALIWDQETVAVLRKDYRIVGGAVGVKGVSNDAPPESLPVLLSPEQAMIAITMCSAVAFSGVPDMGPQTEPRSAVQRLTLEDALNELSAGERSEGSSSDEYAADRLEVFSDLWHRGYVVLGGAAYGGSFTVYESDPSLCHSRATVLVCSSTESLRGSALVAFIRLQQTVSKVSILARVVRGDESNEVQYTSFLFHSASARPRVELQSLMN
eukprot:402649_1